MRVEKEKHTAGHLRPHFMNYTDNMLCVRAYLYRMAKLLQ